MIDRTRIVHLEFFHDIGQCFRLSSSIETPCQLGGNARILPAQLHAADIDHLHGLRQAYSSPVLAANRVPALRGL